MFEKSVISFATQKTPSGEVVAGKSVVFTPKVNFSGASIKWLPDKYKNK